MFLTDWQMLPIIFFIAKVATFTTTITFKYMPINEETFWTLKKELDANIVTIVAVSKTKPVGDIEALYQLGVRNFGENYVQEMVEKIPLLPEDIKWHFIGHLQRNKVKHIAPFVHLIHSVDSLKLLTEINTQAAKLNRTIKCLLQINIAKEKTKFGFDEKEFNEVIAMNLQSTLPHTTIIGVMGVASTTTEESIIRSEFRQLYTLYQTLKNKQPNINVLSIGMSGDYKIALQEGATMIRIGSMLFGSRTILS